MIVDRLPKKAILIGSDVARGRPIGLIPCWVSVQKVYRLISTPSFYGIAMVYRCPRCHWPCRSWSARTQFTAANALLQSTTSLGIIIGPALKRHRHCLLRLATGVVRRRDLFGLGCLPLADRVASGRARHSRPWRHEAIRPAFARRNAIRALRTSKLIDDRIGAHDTFGTGAFTTLFPVFGR